MPVLQTDEIHYCTLAAIIVYWHFLVSPAFRKRFRNVAQKRSSWVLYDFYNLRVHIIEFLARLGNCKYEIQKIRYGYFRADWSNANFNDESRSFQIKDVRAKIFLSIEFFYIFTAGR